MKLEILIENGTPLLVFCQQINRDKTVNVYSIQDGHATATRGYLRTLQAPTTIAEVNKAWGLLRHYAGIAQ